MRAVPKPAKVGAILMENFRANLEIGNALSALHFLTTPTLKESMKSRSGSATSNARSGGKSGGRRSNTLRVSRSRLPAATKSKRPTARKMGSANITTDHDEIRRWAEARKGTPSVVKKTRRGDEPEGILRIDFPGFSGARSLERISWEEWFQVFDQRELAFLYQDRKASGEPSTFNKLVRRSECA